jgi:hypothetical protein
VRETNRARGRTEETVVFIRTHEQAKQILAGEHIVDPIWLGDVDDPDRLGCYLDEHIEWLRTEDEPELRTWARSVRDDLNGTGGDPMTTHKAAKGPERIFCGGTFDNTPGKVAVRCRRCGRVCYEKNEGDICYAPAANAPEVKAIP